VLADVGSSVLAEESLVLADVGASVLAEGSPVLVDAGSAVPEAVSLSEAVELDPAAEDAAVGSAELEPAAEL
jgi:hypothetical protein